MPIFSHLNCRLGFPPFFLRQSVPLIHTSMTDFYLNPQKPWSNRWCAEEIASSTQPQIERKRPALSHLNCHLLNGASLPELIGDPRQGDADEVVGELQGVERAQLDHAIVAAVVHGQADLPAVVGYDRAL